MLSAFSKALAQLGDPRARSAIWIGLAAALTVFFLLWTAVGTVLTETTLFDAGWLETVVDVLGGVATLAITWFLFPAVVSGVIGLFLERVADAVERKHYPGLPPAGGLSAAAAIAATIQFLALVVAANLVTLLFLLIPPVFPFVFYGVNGYLLGREYFELVALRRMDARAARELRASHRTSLFLAGVTTAFLLTVPLVNLIAPIVATAAMVHLFESWRRRDAVRRRANGSE